MVGTREALLSLAFLRVGTRGRRQESAIAAKSPSGTKDDNRSGATSCAPSSDSDWGKVAALGSGVVETNSSVQLLFS